MHEDFSRILAFQWMQFASSDCCSWCLSSSMNARHCLFWFCSRFISFWLCSECSVLSQADQAGRWPRIKTGPRKQETVAPQRQPKTPRPLGFLAWFSGQGYVLPSIKHKLHNRKLRVDLNTLVDTSAHDNSAFDLSYIIFSSTLPRQHTPPPIPPKNKQTNPKPTNNNKKHIHALQYIHSWGKS